MPAQPECDDGGVALGSSSTTHHAPVQSWRAPELGGLDLLHGTFTTHAFARHTHETYSIGLLG